MTQAKDRQRKGYQDSIGIEEYRGKYRLNLARKHARAFFGKPEKRISTGLTVCKENYGKVEQTAWSIHYDILSGNFDTTLVKYGLVQLEVVETTKKQMSLLELWDMYCEFKGEDQKIAITTLEIEFKRRYKNAITEAVNEVGEDALTIRDYLKKNRQPKTVKECLRHLSKAYKLGIEHKNKTGIVENPFDGLAEKIQVPKRNKKTQNNFDNESEDGDDDRRAFTINEMNAIINAFEASGYRQHLAPIIKFLFWTGCRTGEAIGLKWRDIKWDKELITFRRTYNEKLNCFKPTKTGRIRIFPMPENGQLWNLLKSLPEKDLEDVVFSSKTGKTIQMRILRRVWKGNEKTGNPGVIPELIEQGKIQQRLKLYATRHTFVSIQRHVYKRELDVIADWVGNSAMVSKNSYLDRDRITVPGYSAEQKTDAPNDNDSTKQLTELLAGLTPEQVEKLRALLPQV